MSSIKIRAKNIELATSQALEKLKLKKEDVSIKIIEEGSKGFLGFGKKDAEIEVKPLKTTLEKAEQFLEELINAMGIECSLRSVTINNKINIKINSTKDNVLIGKKGKTLEAIEHIVNLAVNKGHGKYCNVSLDISDFMKKKEEALTKLANNVADKVIKTKIRKKMEIMTRTERKIIHKALQDKENIKTRSEGKEPKRYLVIEYKK